MWLFPTLWCDDVKEKSDRGTLRASSTGPLFFFLSLNHSFKATQLKSGSFRVTVDGVPKALDIFA